MLKAVVMAGGKGTRVKQVSEELPKCLLKLNSKTVLEHQLRCLKKEGIIDVTLSLGYDSDKVISYIEENDSFGMNIDFFVEDNALGTSGSLRLIPNLGDNFLLVYGDVIFDIFIQFFLDFHLESKSIATLFVHPNDHPHDSDLVYYDKNYQVTEFVMKGDNKGLIHNSVSSGVFILNSDALKYVPEGKSDLVNDVFPVILSNNLKLSAYNSTEYVKDMGTPQRMKEVEESLKSGFVQNRNLRFRQKAIFLDRDGVINEEVDHLIDKADFKFIPKSIEAIKLINHSDYLCIVVTNQPAVAKGFCEISDIGEIHMYMETLLGLQGAKLDAIFFCPCHPEKGFEGENKRYKRDCNCRKPKTGMLDKAKEKYNLDFSSCFIIGDTTRDIMTGRNAGIKSFLVNTGYAGNDKTFDVTPDYICGNLYDAVKEIVKS